MQDDFILQRLSKNNGKTHLHLILLCTLNIETPKQVIYFRKLLQGFSPLEKNTHIHFERTRYVICSLLGKDKEYFIIY